MRTEVPSRADAVARRAAAAAEAEIAGALSALPGLPPAARAAQRLALEALVGELVPPAPAGESGLPRWILFLSAAALLLAVARFGPDGRKAPPTPRLPVGDTAGAAVPTQGGGRPTVGLPDPAASLRIPARTSPPPAAATPASHAGAHLPGPSAGAPVGRDALTPAVSPRAIASSPGQAATFAPGRPGGASGATPPRSSTRAISATGTASCRPEALPPIPAGAGPWLVGRVQDERCRPLADLLLVVGKVDGGTEFLARTEADGSYVVAPDPGTYHVELLVDEAWWAPNGSLDAAGTVTLGAADVPLRLDFVVGGGER